MKHNARFFFIFTGTLLLFLWPLISMRSLYIGGDHWTQFYPWFKSYAACIKHFSLPFWVTSMHGGFPLMAEGQIGGFYPLNAIFFFFLPFTVAYNYLIVFHFIIAGVAIYFFTRMCGADEWGAILAAIIFCFGSAYAGCFCNVATLRVLSWLPLVLLLTEQTFEKKQLRYILIAGVLFGCQLLAGSVQLALYCGIFYLLYGICRARTVYAWLAGVLFFVIAALLFLPQALLTYQLSLLSSRPAADIQFALWGSFNPLGLVGSIFPYWARFVRFDFYLSIFGMLFLFASWYAVKTDKRIRALAIIAVIALMLAMGKFNPLYVAVIQAFHLYSFRLPSKFLFFAAFASSVLIGRGFSEFMKEDFPHRRTVVCVYSWFLMFCGLVFVVSKIILVVGKDLIISWGRQYAERHIFATASHRYDLAAYVDKVHVLYATFLAGASFANIFNVVAWCLAITALIASCMIMQRRTILPARYARGIIICVIIADLFVYSFIGREFRSNFRTVEYLHPTHPIIFNYLKNDTELFRVLPYDIASGKLPSWLLPNANGSYGIDSIAAYTPLANRAYREALLPLEIVDDSLGVRPPRHDALHVTMPLIRLLNVKYLISDKKITDQQLIFLCEEDNVFLYQLCDYVPRSFVLARLDSCTIDRTVPVTMAQYKPGDVTIAVTMPYDGFLIFSENNYPGWTAQDNGRAIPIQPYFIVQAVKLTKGPHTVHFVYRPWNIR